MTQGAVRCVGVKLLICELTSKAMPVTYFVMSGIDSGGWYGTAHEISYCRCSVGSGGQGRARRLTQVNKGRYFCLN